MKPLLFVSAAILLASSGPAGSLVKGEDTAGEVASLCGKWRELPNLDANYQPVEGLPPGLQGDWIAVAESLDGGKTCADTDEGERILRASAKGWSSGDASVGASETPFLMISRNDEDPDTPAWFIATGKNLPFYLLHTPRGKKHFLVRKLAIDGDVSNVREVRRFVAQVAPPRVMAAKDPKGRGTQRASAALAFDLREAPPQGTVVSNAYVHKEPFGGEATYWAPRKLNSWARIKYKVSAPFPIESVVLQGVGVHAWNRHADQEFDPQAKAILEVSADGRKWTPIFSSDPDHGVKTNDEWFAVVRGSKEFFIQARLFGTRQANPSVHHVQFLRGEPGRGDIPRMIVFSDAEGASQFRKDQDEKAHMARHGDGAPKGGGRLGKAQETHVPRQPTAPARSPAAGEGTDKNIATNVSRPGGGVAQQQLDGFRGIPWGTDLTALPGMKRNGQLGPDFVWYVRDGERLQFGDAKLFQVSYLAYKGRLFRADINAIHEDKKKLSDVVSATFGRMDSVNDPAHLGVLWPQNLKGPITGARMCLLQTDKTIIVHIEEYVTTVAGEVGSETLVSFIDRVTAEAINANPPKTTPASLGDF